jgi:hypothetical protein
MEGVLMKARNYEVELRYAGPKAKAIGAAMKLFLDRASSAYIESHLENDDAKRKPAIQEALEYGAAIDNLIRDHAMHVVWGGEPEEEIRRHATNAKSPKVKKALEKLAEQVSGAKPTRKPAAGDDDGRFE